MAFDKIFDDHFIYGVLAGASIIFILLIRMVSWEFAFDTDQIHAYTLLWLCGSYALLFSKSQVISKHAIKRALYCILFLYMVWEIHDFYWCTATFFLPYLHRGVLFSTLLDYPVIIGRVSLVLAIGVVFCYKYINFNWRLALMLGLQFGFFLATMWYGAILPPAFLPVAYFFDTLPAFYLVRRTQKPSIRGSPPPEIPRGTGVS